jgi:hypothetical protein
MNEEIDRLAGERVALVLRPEQVVTIDAEATRRHWTAPPASSRTGATRSSTASRGLAVDPVRRTLFAALRAEGKLASFRIDRLTGT